MTKGKGKTPGSGGLMKHITRRPHKERLQPEERRHLGHLEKHRDYKSRAKLHHMKEAKVKELERQVAERNPDEFYFEMIHSSVDGKSGKHVAGSDKKRTTTQQIALNSKDIMYLEYRRNMLRNDIQKMREKQAVFLPSSGLGVEYRAKRVESHVSRVEEGNKSRKRPMPEVCMHTKFTHASDEDFQRDERESSEVREHSKALECEIDDDEASAHEVDETEDADDSAKDLHALEKLYSRIDRVLGKLRLQTNLIKKGRRRKMNSSTEDKPVYKWTTTRRRN